MLLYIVKYNPYSDKYCGYCSNGHRTGSKTKEFDVMDNTLCNADVALFHRLKEELLGHLTQKYIDDEDEQIDLHHPVIFQYIKDERRTSNSQCLMFDIDDL